MTMDYLHDFREDVVLRKRDKEYWNGWNTWNILYKTLAYELSSSYDVERYKYVRNQVFEIFSDYENYIDGNATLDIMNGWWFCFKTLFDIKTSRRSYQTRKFLLELSTKIKKFDRDDNVISFICENYNIAETEMKSLYEFLKVVYTIGNITPISKNPSADCFDSWEYKLFVSDSTRYLEPGYKKYFGFEDYSKDNIQWAYKLKNSVEKNKVIVDYMDSRTNLIKMRGERLTKKRTKL